MIAFDTNVLVYAVDQRDGPRREVAYRVLDAALERGDAMVPLRVYAEFLHVARRKLQLSVTQVRPLIQTWQGLAATAPCLPDDLDAAMDAHERHGLSVFDALIWAVCERAGARILVTEDLQDGRTLGRVTFLSPFNPANARRLAIP